MVLNGCENRFVIGEKRPVRCDSAVFQPIILYLNYTENRKEAGVYSSSASLASAFFAVSLNG